MAKRNRARRAEKRRADARAGRRRGPGGPRPHTGGPGRAPEDERLSALALEELMVNAAQENWRGATGVCEIIVDRLIEAHTVEELSRAMAGPLQRALRCCWDNGWQPADLMHTCVRRLQKGHRPVIEDAVVLESRFYRSSPGADPEWLDQLPSAVPGIDDLDDLHILRRWAGTDEVLAVAPALLSALEVLGELFHLPRIAELRPPPSRWGHEGRHRRTGATSNAKMTERVLALLAKAESTTFPAEAEALTAKAQELIASGSGSLGQGLSEPHQVRFDHH